MNMIALLILAVVAGFLFYNLRSVLGQTPYDPKKRNQERKNYRESEDASLFPSSSESDTDMQDDYFAPKAPQEEDIHPVTVSAHHRFIAGPKENQEKITAILNEIKEKYPAFHLNKFIDGAKSAYNMIISAFEQNTLDEVKDFISADIYKEFSELRALYAEKKYDYTNVITTIESVIIKDAVCGAKDATLTIEIKSQNVMSLKDENGEIIHGDPDHVHVVTDIWTMQRDFTSSSPAWILIAK
ncbi:MAG: Tim44/TimA family putative adaptor protein [Pseudomonadota bacterium]